MSKNVPSIAGTSVDNDLEPCFTKLLPGQEFLSEDGRNELGNTIMAIDRDIALLEGMEVLVTPVCTRLGSQGEDILGLH